MRPLNGHFKKGLFDGYGPLSAFSAKIDLSYALSILDRTSYNDLTVVRKIRNDFAHSIDLIDFETPAIREHFKQFKSFHEGVTDYRGFYLERLTVVDRQSDRVLEDGKVPAP